MSRRILTSSRSPQEGNLHYYHLPKGMLLVKVSRSSQGAHNIDATATHMPDPDRRYFFQYHVNPYTHDVIDIEFTKEGYLKKIDTAIEDKTVDIITKVAELAEEAAKTTALRDVGGMVVYEATIDPFDPEAMARVNRDFESLNIGYTLDITPMRRNEDTVAIFEAEAAESLGVYCRPMEPFEIIVRKGQAERRKIVKLPHPDIIHFIQIPSARFVNNKFLMEFDEAGYPFHIHVEKPSPALAVMEIPIRIAKAILEIPAKIFQFRINLNNEKTKVLQSEEKLAQYQETRAASEQVAASAERAAVTRELNETRSAHREMLQEIEALRKRT